MTHLKKVSVLSLVLTVFFVLLMSQNVFAEADDAMAGITITNTATLNYSVSNIGQTPLSRSVDFVVDHKIRPLVTNAGDDLFTTPGSAPSPIATADYVAFTVTNNGNTNTANTLTISLTTQFASGSPMTSRTMYLDNTAGTSVGTYGADDTTIIAEGDTINLARDTSATIFLVATVPSTLVNDQTSTYHLIATAWDPTASPEAPLGQDTDGDDPTLSENVFMDGASENTRAGDVILAGDVANDGMHSDSATFTVQSAIIGMTKELRIESDLTGNVFPDAYPLPGSVVHYRIRANNTGDVAATNVTISDIIQADTTYIAGTLHLDGALQTDTDESADATPLDYSNYNSGTNTITVDNLTIPTGGADTIVEFDVTIN